MAFYGRTYTLGSPDNHGLHAPVKKWDTNGGKPGLYTNESGFLSYFEICQDEEGWTKEFDSVGMCPYMFKGNQWIGYEDQRSLIAKMEWLKKEKYGGAMIWALDLDDYRGVCDEKDILFNTLVRGLEGYSVCVPPAHELTTTKKPNPWWPPQNQHSSTTNRPSTSQRTNKPTRFTEPTTRRTSTTSTSTTTTTKRPQGNISTEKEPERERKPIANFDKTGECSSESTGQLLSSFRPHPTDSSMYLWCVNGKQISLTCPPDTTWNNTDKQCTQNKMS